MYDRDGMSFNSMIVRLKACMHIKDSLAIASFNSMIVRLKDAGRKADDVAKKFQFYDSPIKSSSWPDGALCSSWVSIL